MRWDSQTPGAGPAEEPALVKSFFHVCRGYLVFCPRAILEDAEDAGPAASSLLGDAAFGPDGVGVVVGGGGGGGHEVLDHLVGLAVACAECLTERDSLRACLGFLGNLFALRDARSAPTHRAADAASASAASGFGGGGSGGDPCEATGSGGGRDGGGFSSFERCVLPVAAARGERLVRGLLACLAGGVATTLRDPVIECLASVRTVQLSNKRTTLTTRTQHSRAHPANRHSYTQETKTHTHTQHIHTI